jgi:hypothetical protein
MTYRKSYRHRIQRGTVAAAVTILVLLAGSCATTQEPTEETEAEAEPFSDVSTVVIAPFEYRSTVTGTSGNGPAESLDPEVAQAVRAELAKTLEESGRQVIVLSGQETSVLVPGEVDEMAARLGADMVIRGEVRLGASGVDYVVSVSSTVASAEAEETSVTVSAQEQYGRGALDVEAVTSGVGAVVIGQVMGLLAAR